MTDANVYFCCKVASAAVMAKIVKEACDCNLFDGNDDDAALLPSLVGADNDDARDENKSFTAVADNDDMMGMWACNFNECR